MSAELIEKYEKVLSLYDPKKVDVEELAEIIDKSVSTIKNNHDKYEQQHKIAGVLVIVKLYRESSSFKKNRIEEILKGFYQYFDDEYRKYIDSLVFIRERFDADLSFYYNYLIKEKGS